MSASRPGFLHQVPKIQVPVTSTDVVPEGATNKYFTEARVRATPMTGLVIAGASTILPADTLLQAAAKLQAQINGIVPAVPLDYGLITSSPTSFQDWGSVP